MPTNQKTSLGLNRWQGTDKPMRSDFVADNDTLDALLTGHFADTDKHLTDVDRLILNGPVVGTYAGNGAASRTVTLAFSPKAVLVFMADAPVQGYDSSRQCRLENVGFATQQGGTRTLSLAGAAMTVHQAQGTPAADGTAENLNRTAAQYLYVAFR